MAESSDLREGGAQVVGAVSTWVRETGELLQQLQRLLEGAELDPSIIGLAPKDLLPRVRQCRAQIPCPESIRAWVDSMRPADDSTG